MAKKETTKKKTTKKDVKKLEEQAPIEVQEFEEAAALEVVEETKVEPENIAPAEVEVMNGDPAVVTPVEEAEPLVEEQEKIEEESVEEETPEPQEEIKPKKNVFKRMFGYIWNGQEMDY